MQEQVLHEHNFIYAGIRYRDTNQRLSGTGACRRYYAHIYYCNSCLEKRSESIENEETTYATPKWGAVPGGEEVPLTGNVYSRW